MDMLPTGFKSRIVARPAFQQRIHLTMFGILLPMVGLVSPPLIVAGSMFQIQKSVARKGASEPYVSPQRGQ